MELEHLDEQEQQDLENALFGFPETIEGAFRMYQECAAWSKRLDTRAKGLKKFLRNAMSTELDEVEQFDRKPERDKVEIAKEGVFRSAWVQGSTKYKDALEVIKEKLVPKTKHKEVDGIVEEFTTYGLRDKFTEVKE